MLYIAGKKMSKTKSDKAYWKASLLAFIPYFVVLGLRFGHNIDWNHYYETYTEHNVMDWQTTEPLFHFTFYFFYSLGVPYFLVISLQVILFMYSFLLIAKYFRNCLYFILPLLPIVAQSNDNYIRWYWAVSFVLIAFYYLLSNNKNRIWKIILFFIAGVLVHNGAILLVFFILFYFFAKNKSLPPFISSIAVFFSIFFISISIIGYLSDFATLIYLMGGDNLQETRLSGYLLKVEDIASGGLSDVTGIKEYGLVNKIMTVLAFIPVIYYGPRYLNKYKYGILYYNLFLLGAFLNPFLSTVEIFDRYSKFLLIFQAVVSGIVYYKLLVQKFNKGIKILCIISMFCCSYQFIRYSLFTNADYRMQYIWNAGDKERINPDLYIDNMLNNRK